MKKLHNIFCFPKIDNDEDIRFCEMIEQILILSHICDVFEQDSTGNKHMFKEEKWGGERKRERMIFQGLIAQLDLVVAGLLLGFSTNSSSRFSISYYHPISIFFNVTFFSSVVKKHIHVKLLSLVMNNHSPYI